MRKSVSILEGRVQAVSLCHVDRHATREDRCRWVTDLGMPETLWVIRVKEFVSLIISIDTKGKNLIEENKAVLNEMKKPILERINQQIHFIK
jgi:tartrate dehydratase beta subunit/fumarate hydratase class I family protein